MRWWCDCQSTNGFAILAFPPIIPRRGGTKQRATTEIAHFISEVVTCTVFYRLLFFAVALTTHIPSATANEKPIPSLEILALSLDAH